MNRRREKRDIFELSRTELASQLADWGAGDHVLRALWRLLHRDLASLADVGEESQFSNWLRTQPALSAAIPERVLRRLDDEYEPTRIEVVHEQHSRDGLTRKFLLQLHDGVRIETVLMRFRGRHTACLSSQAGCALGCVFCATGQAGFTRQLTAGEIVAQALFVERRLREARAAAGPRPAAARAELNNVVLMGMGEPLLNYDAVMRSLEILGESSGLAIGGKQMTLSTVGVVPGILRLADEARPYSLAVSLHAATQTERLAMIPAAAPWPLDELLDACRYYTTKLQRKIFFEWTLIAGQNDSVEQARRLADLLGDLPAQVNLIPLNPTLGYEGDATSSESERRFQSTLREAGVPATIRQRRGIDIAAGCGQLATDARVLNL